MHFDYSKRDYLLPAGCKDLIDAIHYSERPDSVKIGPADIAPGQNDLIVTLKFPEAHIGNIDIFVEGQQIRIIPRALPNHPMAQRVVDTPAGYNPAAARAVYLGGVLRIVIPKL